MDPWQAGQLDLWTLLDGVVHPGWTWDFVRAEPIRFANVVGRAVGDGADAVSLADYINTQFDPGLSWREVEWFLSIWKGPLVLKGIQTVEDARLAAEAGPSPGSLQETDGSGRFRKSPRAPLARIPSSRQDDVRSTWVLKPREQPESTVPRDLATNGA